MSSKRARSSSIVPVLLSKRKDVDQIVLDAILLRAARIKGFTKVLKIWKTGANIMAFDGLIVSTLIVNRTLTTKTLPLFNNTIVFNVEHLFYACLVSNYELIEYISKSIAPEKLLELSTDNSNRLDVLVKKVSLIIKLSLDYTSEQSRVFRDMITRAQNTHLDPNQNDTINECIEEYKKFKTERTAFRNSLKQIDESLPCIFKKEFEFIEEMFSYSY